MSSRQLQQVGNSIVSSDSDLLKTEANNALSKEEGFQTTFLTSVDSSDSNNVKYSSKNDSFLLDGIDDDENEENLSKITHEGSHEVTLSESKFVFDEKNATPLPPSVPLQKTTRLVSKNYMKDTGVVAV